MTTILNRIRKAVHSPIHEERSDVVDATTERERWLDAVHDLATRLAGQEDLDSLIHRAAELARERLHSETAAVFLLGEEGRLHRRAIVGLPDDWFPDESYAPEEGLTSRVVQPRGGARYGQPIVVNQVDQDPRVIQYFLEAYCQALESGQVRHLIAVPLNGRQGTFGVLRVVNRLDEYGRLSSEGFSSTDVDLLSILGHVVAVAVENARFREEAERRALELERLQQASRRMTTTLDSEQLLQTLVDIGATVVESDHISIIEVHEDNTWGKIISDYKADSLEPHRSDGLARQIQRTLEPMVFDKVVDNGFHNPALVKAGVKSYAGVPVISEGRLRAIIFFHSLKPAAYRGKLPLLLTFANQVATAMRNCELFEQEQAKRLLAERLQAASSAVLSSLDRKEILEHILTEIAAVVPYDSASIQLLQEDQLEIIACRGFSEPEEALGLTFSMDIMFPSYQVIRRKEWCIVDDVRASYPHFAEPRWHTAHARSWLGIPLVYRGLIIGVLSLDHKKPAFYQHNHAETALSFAAQAAVAIQMAHLFKEVLHEEASRVERMRLEDELHEAMNILATGAMWEADALEEYAPQLSEEAAYGFQRLRQAMRRTYQDLKYILADLRNPILEEQGLVVALSAYAEMMGHNLVTVQGDRTYRIPYQYEYALYRIGQEAINNAIKHSGIKRPEDGSIRVLVELGPYSARLCVSDDGIGFDAEHAVRQLSVPSGLIRLRELAESVGIELEVQSEVGKGTEVRAQVEFVASEK